MITVDIEISDIPEDERRQIVENIEEGFPYEHVDNNLAHDLGTDTSIKIELAQDDLTTSQHEYLNQCEYIRTFLVREGGFYPLEDERSPLPRTKTYKQLLHGPSATLEVRDVAAQETVRHLQLENERIISIIRKHRDELEAQAQHYDAMDWQHIPQATRDRKFSVIDAEMSLLRSIIEEIGVEHFETQEAQA